MYLKVYETEQEVLVAVCDEKYLDREFEEGDIALKVTKGFYGDKHASYEEVADALKSATIANLVGEESVACALEQGIIESDHIIYVQNVPHAQMVRA
mgnify:FL=1